MKRTIPTAERTYKVSKEVERDGWLVAEVRLGPMSDAEREELLSIAEAVREKNIDPALCLRVLFLDPPPKPKSGRKRGSARVRVGSTDYPDPAEAERNERRVAFYDQSLAMLTAFNGKAPASARTVAQLRQALRPGDGFAPHLEAVAAHRAARAEGRKGEATLEALAACIAMGEPDEPAAIKELRRIRQAVGRARQHRVRK